MAMADDSATLPQNSSQIETTRKKRPTKRNVESCLSWSRHATTISSLILILFSIETESSATGWKYARAPRIGHFGHGRTGPNIFVGRGGGFSTGENDEIPGHDVLDVRNDDYDNEFDSGAVDAAEDGSFGSVGDSDEGGGSASGDSDSTKDETLGDHATAPLSEAEGDEIIHDFNAQLRKIRAEIEAEAIREIEGLRMEIAAARKKKAPPAGTIQQEEISKDHARQDGRQEEETEVQEKEEFICGREEERRRPLDEHGKSIDSDSSWFNDSCSAGGEVPEGDKLSALLDKFENSNFENKVENELDENEAGSYLHAKQSAGISESRDGLTSKPSLSWGQKCTEEGFVVGDTDEDDDEVVEKLRVWEEEEERDQHELVESFFTKEDNAERADQEEEDEIAGEIFHHDELGYGKVKSDSELQQDVQPPAEVYDKQELECVDAVKQTKDAETEEDIALSITSSDEGELDAGAVATPAAAEHDIDSGIESKKGGREESTGIHVVPSQTIGHRTTLSKRPIPESLSTKTSRKKKKRRKKRHKKEPAFGKADRPLSERDIHDFQREGDNKAFSEEDASAIEYVSEEIQEGEHHSPLVAFVRNVVFYALLIFLLLVARVAFSTVSNLIGLNGFVHFFRQN